MYLRRSRRVGHSDDREGVYELVAVEQASHHALVVTKERETHDSGDGDAQAERPTTQAAGGRPHIAGANKVRTVSVGRRGERKVGEELVWRDNGDELGVEELAIL